MVKLFTTASFVLFSSLVVAADASTIAASTSSSTCDPCIDRNSVKIGVVHHGLPIEDVYWEHMNEAITQGAKDTNIDLHYKPLLDGHTLDRQQKIFDEMSAQIEEYCSTNGDDESAMDALLVTLPNDSILPAVLTCKEKNIKIVVFNVGLELAESNGLLFVGQDEFEAGYKAGEGLNNNTTTKVMCCANHSPGNAVLNKRCGGMAASVAVSEGDAAITSTYDVPVNPNDCSSFTAAIVNQCSPPEGDWSTVGLYLAGGKATHKCGMEFLKEHPEVSVTASDVSVDLYEGMANNSGLNVLFGIDQQSYLQGYLPFSFLTLAVTNNQAVINSKIETGPSLVYNPPSEDEVVCKANYYAVCSDDDTASGGNTSSNDNVNNVGIASQSTDLVDHNAWANQHTESVGHNILAIVLAVGFFAFFSALILVKMNQYKKKKSDSSTTLAGVPTTLTGVRAAPAKINDIEEANTVTSLGSKEIN